MPDAISAINSNQSNSIEALCGVTLPLKTDVQDAIVSAASQRIKQEGRYYAFEEAPTSPLWSLSGNKVPGKSRPGWLKNQHKCNQFVGDVLTQAGVIMPTYRMTDGSRHYMLAEALPKQGSYFDKITNLNCVEPGDIMVIDYRKQRGSAGGHTEVIVSKGYRGRQLIGAGAHSDGAYYMDKLPLFKGASYNSTLKAWQTREENIFILRPKRAY